MSEQGVLIEDFVKQMGRYVGAWLSKIDDLPKLQDPYSVGQAYIQHLAKQVNLTLVEDDDTTLVDLRKQLANVVDWYKIKGTYDALEIIAYVAGYRGNAYDLYTSDYAIFRRIEPCFAGAPGENPPGLGLAYYKSPHFVLELLLDQIFGAFPNQYLWKDAQIDRIRTSVESMRPANTVPHYSVLLNPQTTEDEQCQTTAENIITRVTQNWQQAILHLDMTSSLDWWIDGGKYLDRPSAVFLNSITKWRLGTGNANVSPCDSGFAISNIVLSGTIDEIRIYGDRVEYDFIVPEAYVASGLHELALVKDDNVTEVLHSTFPSVDKTLGMELRVLVQIYFIT